MPADVVYSPPSNDSPTHSMTPPGASQIDTGDGANQASPGQGETASPPLFEVPAPSLSPHDTADFLLHPAELARGRRAAENYLSNFRSDETRKLAEEALETLATVISGGKCDSLEFPWQQVKPYHGAAALTILKQKGSPARIEALRCRRDSTRNYRMVPDAYPTKQVQKIRSTLSKVIEQCSDMGFMGDLARDANEAVLKTSKTRAKAGAKASKEKKTASPQRAKQARILGTGELRALMANCAARAQAAGCRDAVLFALAYRGLKTTEITALGIDSVCVDKHGGCQIVVRPKTGRTRRVELTNEELIYLEDWLDIRGNDPGPLLCTVGRGSKTEGKRLSNAVVKEICEQRGAEAEVEEFTPADLTRSAEAFTTHRKGSRRKADKNAEAALTVVETLLFEGQANDADAHPDGESIRFPFLGLTL